MLGVHPQAAFETCAHLAGHGNTPARQRPDLAVVLTAGLAAQHDMRGEYGIDIEDLNPGHSQISPGLLAIQAGGGRRADRRGRHGGQRPGPVPAARTGQQAPPPSAIPPVTPP